MQAVRREQRRQRVEELEQRLGVGVEVHEHEPAPALGADGREAQAVGQRAELVAVGTSPRAGRRARSTSVWYGHWMRPCQARPRPAAEPASLTMEARVVERRDLTPSAVRTRSGPTGRQIAYSTAQSPGDDELLLATRGPPVVTRDRSFCILECPGTPLRGVAFPSGRRPRPTAATSVSSPPRTQAAAGRRRGLSSGITSRGEEAHVSLGVLVRHAGVAEDAVVRVRRR